MSIRPKKVTVFNDRIGIRETYPSMTRAARALDVDVSRVSRAARTGQWVFTPGMSVRVKRVV